MIARRELFVDVCDTKCLSVRKQTQTETDEKGSMKEETEERTKEEQEEEQGGISQDLCCS